MIGLEKVTGRILEEARRDAEKTLAAAEEKKNAILASADERIAVLRETANAEIADEGKNIISRAQSTAEMQNRNIILSQKCESLDRVFRVTEERICALPAEEYAAFLCDHAAAAVREAAGCGTCVLSFGQNDTPDAASSALALFEKRFPGIRFSLSGKTARISNGVILDFGDIDVDCSVRSVLAENRPALEGALCQLLFESTKNK